MTKAWRFITDREPAATAGALTALVNLVALFTAWNPSPDQLAGLNAGLGVVLAWAVRTQVTPTQTGGG